MTKKILLVAIIVLYVAFSIFAAYVGVEKIIEKYSPNDEVAPYYSGSGTMLVIEDELINSPSHPVVTDGEVFLPFEIVKQYIDSTIYKDSSDRVVTVTSKDRVIRMNSVEMESYVNMEPMILDFTSRYFEGVLYVPVITFKDIFEIDVNYIEDKDTVIIDFWKNYEHTGVVSPYIEKEQSKGNTTVVKSQKVAESIAVRTDPSVQAPLYVEIPEAGESVTVYEINGDWAKIRTMDGIVGYVETRFLKASVETRDISINPVRRSVDEPTTIIMAWQYIYMTTPPVEDFISHEEITVYSPTWFVVIDSEGNLENKADASYTEEVKKTNSVIWPLVSNTFNDIEMTSMVLNNPDARDNIIRQLMAYAQLYELDGYNFDFENIYLKDRDAYTQFIRELMPYADAMELIISVDVGVPGGSDNYSLCYDHAELSKTADYIAVMTYDQYWATSPTAGSQAQLAWVEEMINLTLEEGVSPEKLIMGIPFYTRIWQEKDGTVKNIATPGMEDVTELIEEKAAYVTWEEESGQYYASYYEDGASHRMWIEDAVSVGLKAELAKKYGLRGVAVWQLALGNDEAWESIKKGMDGSEVD